MERTVTMRIGDQTGTVTLFEDDAPETTDAFWELLPYSHSPIIPGWYVNEIGISTPRITEVTENTTTDLERGNLAYWPTGPAVVYYPDTVTEYSPVGVIGTVTENVEGITRNAHRVQFETNTGTGYEPAMEMAFERGEP
jgi:hypothetical protein